MRCAAPSNPGYNTRASSLSFNPKVSPGFHEIRSHKLQGTTPTAGVVDGMAGFPGEGPQHGPQEPDAQGRTVSRTGTGKVVSEPAQGVDQAGLASRTDAE